MERAGGSSRSIGCPRIRPRRFPSSISRSRSDMIAPERLARLPLFRDVSPAVVNALAKRGTVVTAATDQVLFLTDSESRGWCIVLEGEGRLDAVPRRRP